MRRHTTHWSRGGVLHAGWVEGCGLCAGEDLDAALEAGRRPYEGTHADRVEAGA